MTVKHKHLIVRAKVEFPLLDTKKANKWMKELVNLIDMKILAGPYSKYVHKEGNRGLTIVCIIETSHIAAHFWDEENPALLQLDVYTCGELNVNSVLNYVKHTLNSKSLQYKFLDREHSLVDILV